MRNDLNDELPMDAWGQRRMVQVGPSRAKLRTLPMLRDDMPMAEWVALRNDQKQGGGAISGGEGAERLVGGDGGDRLEGRSRSIAQPARPDPRRTEVFKPGPDGKLHPVEGWHTTGPFAFGEWAGNVDWGGVADDLATVGFGAISGAGVEKLTLLEAARQIGSLYAMGKEVWQAQNKAAARDSER